MKTKATLILFFSYTVFITFDVIGGAAMGGVGFTSNARNARFHVNGQTQSNNTELLNLKNIAVSVLSQSAKLKSTNGISTSSPMVLTKSDIELISTARNSWLTFLNNSSNISMNIGVEDNVNAQTWILPANILDIFQSYYNEDFIPTQEVPFDLQFPLANKVMKSTYLDGGNNEIDLYEHYILGDDSITFLGNSYYYYLNGDEDAFDAVDYKFTDIPLSLGDSYSFIQDDDRTDYQGLAYYDRTKSVDAFGTIETPYGTMECLRISVTSDFYTRPNTGSAYTLDESFFSVAFVTQFGHYIQGNVSGKVGTVTLSNIEFRVVAPTGILSPVETVQINNDGNGVLISNTGVYIDVLTKTADPNAILDLSSDDKGLMIPRLEEANRPIDPNEGLLIYQVDNSPGFYYYDGAAWQRLDNSAPAPSARKAASRSNENAMISLKGIARLKSGSAFIPFENSNPDNVIIQLQAEGENNGLFISKKTAKGFEVKEQNQGKSNIKFSYTINL